MVHQDVVLADAGKDVVALGQDLGQARLERRVHQVRAIHLVRHGIQAHQVDDAWYPVEIVLVEAELLQQEPGHDLRTVVGDFQAHGVAEVALRQFALQCDAQILHLFVIDEQVGVARDAELVTAQHVHAGKQFADAGMQDRGEEDEAVVNTAKRLRQTDHARQGTRRLHDRCAGIAPEGVGALELDGEVETLVQHAREGVGRIEPDRRQHRHYLPDEEVANPCALFVVPQAAAEKRDAFLFQCRKDRVVEQGVLFGNQVVGLHRDTVEYVERGHAVRTDGVAAQL